MSLSQTKILSYLYLLTVAWGIATFWMAPHLPLLDYPQHAGQASLLRDLLLTESKWSALVTINYFTPNLAVYSLVLLLMTFVQVNIAFAIVLSVAYGAFIYFAVALRKHFKADAKLDWLFFIPFFGYGYFSGFMTYVISAPIALWFILLADRYAIRPTLKGAIGLAMVGLLLLETHGLMFLFSFGVGGALLINHSKSIKSFFTNVIPYVIILAVFIVLYIFNNNFNVQLKTAEFAFSNAHSVIWDLSPRRILQALVYTFSISSQAIANTVFYPMIVIMFSAPLLFNLRINWHHKSAIIFFVLTFGTILFFPDIIFSTTMVYQRYAILLIISYALMFSRQGNSTSSLFSSTIPTITLGMVMICSWVFLAYQSQTNIQFKQATKEIDQWIVALEPNQKMLYITSNKNDQYSAFKDLAYDNYGQWYQAENKGFVELSFAVLPPFPVRYKQGYAPDLEGSNGAKYYDKSNYRYILHRNNTDNEQHNDLLFKNESCKAIVLNKIPHWTLFDNQQCMTKQPLVQ